MTMQCGVVADWFFDPSNIERVTNVDWGLGTTVRWERRPARILKRNQSKRYRVSFLCHFSIVVAKLLHNKDFVLHEHDIFIR